MTEILSSELELPGGGERPRGGLQLDKAVIHFPAALGVNMPQSKISTIIKLKIHPELSKIQ